jgi:hypothetical protein
MNRGEDGQDEAPPIGAGPFVVRFLIIVDFDHGYGVFPPREDAGRLPLLDAWEDSEPGKISQTFSNAISSPPSFPAAQPGSQ